MKRLIIPLLLFAPAVSAQTVTVTFTGFPASALSDINAHWLSETGPSFGVASAAIDGVSTSITVAVSQSTLIAAAPMPPVGSACIMDSEPMTVAAVSGQNITLQRGTLALSVLATHAQGVSIFPLVYASPWQMLFNEAIKPWFQGVVAQLGAKSATLSATATGTVSQ